MRRHTLRVIVLVGLLLVAMLAVSWASVGMSPGNRVGAGYRSSWRPRIAIVWPHDGKGNPTSVDKSRAVNVAVWPSEGDCTERLTDSTALPTLAVAVNNELALPVSVKPQMVERTANGRSFQSLEYNDIPADLVANPTGKFRFFASYNHALDYSNVWVHASDPRTYAPDQVIPTGYSSDPKELDIRIQLVWPHDDQGRFAPVDKAYLVDVAVDIFEHGTTKSVLPNYELRSQEAACGIDCLWLHALDERGVGPGGRGYAETRPRRVTYTVNGEEYPRWIFRDVYFFNAQQEQRLGQRPYSFFVYPTDPELRMRTYSTVWTHAGSDARTYMPSPAVPTMCP